MRDTGKKYFLKKKKGKEKPVTFRDMISMTS